MESFLLVSHIILSFVIVIVILLQSGQGGGMGAGFGGAAAVGQEIFGGRGAATFLGKLTVFLGASFMITSMALAWYSSKPQSVLDLSSGSAGGGQAQVHQIIEQGSGSGGAPGGELMQEFQNPGSEGDAQEIPPEILEQLRQMQGDEAGQPVELDGSEAPIQLDVTEEPAGEQPAEPAPAEEPAAEQPAEPAPAEPTPAEEPAAEQPAEPAAEPAPAEEPEAAEESEEE